MTENVKPFPPMLPGDSTPVTADEAARINVHCQSMYDEIKRLRHALDEIWLSVSYVNVHGVGEQAEPNGLPQPVRVKPDEFWSLFQRIGKIATEALGTEQAA
jgi:hypothetical protein